MVIRIQHQKVVLLITRHQVILHQRQKEITITVDNTKSKVVIKKVTELMLLRTSKLHQTIKLGTITNRKTNKNYCQQGIAKSGADGLLLDICAGFKNSNSIELLC